MVRETVRSVYTSRLPAPSIHLGGGEGRAPPTSKVPRRGEEGGVSQSQEQQVQEILELKRALARTKQDLIKTRTRRQGERHQDNRSSSEEDSPKKPGPDLSASLSGSLNGLSNSKPCLNRELVAKLRSMTETIKMLSTENVGLREENDNLLSLREEAGHDRGDIIEAGETGEDHLRSVVAKYEDQLREMGEQLMGVQGQLLEVRGGQEKDKYKSLARRLKEERNQYKELVDRKKAEHGELKVEIEKMTEIIGELRDNCGSLQAELLNLQTESPRPSAEDKGCQTTRPLDLQASSSSRRVSEEGGLLRRASMGEVSRSRASPAKRQKSNLSPQTCSSPRMSAVTQQARTRELSRPKVVRQASGSGNSASQGSPPPKACGGARIVKPVPRLAAGSSPEKMSPQQSHGKMTPSPRSPGVSKIPCFSKIPTPNKSRLPTPTKRSLTQMREYKETEEVLVVQENDISMTMSAEDQDEQEQINELRENNEDLDEEFPPPPTNTEVEAINSNPEANSSFPDPPLDLELPPPHLMVGTPRTLRRADSLRQKMAARRIQRTWKHFYQELEEKKAEDLDLSKMSQDSQQERQEREGLEQARHEAISSLQAAILGHDARSVNLAAARARGGIYTARPWVVSNSETDSDTETDNYEAVQGIIRSHSFRLKTLEEEDNVFSVGKVSSIRAKFTRRSPDGASDVSESDRNV